LENDLKGDGEQLYIANYDATHLIGKVSQDDGKLDRSFGQDGIIITDIGWINVTEDLTIQLTVKLSWQAVLKEIFLSFVITLGSLDTSFDGDGIVLTDFGWTDKAA
jgi:hypothetical protein